jgi:hypothetical protein
MGSPNLVPTPNPDDKKGIIRAIAKLASLRLNADSTPTFAELTLGGGLNTGYVDYDPTVSLGDGEEGRSKWNPNEHTLDLTTGLGPILQVGQESFVIVYNDTGSPILNGTAVYPVGAINGRPSVAEAAANTHVTFAGVVLVTTMDIPDGTEGIASQDGKVRGVDTSGFTLGDTLWLSEDGDGILNNLTNIRPSFPSYAIQVGGVSVEDADGTIQLEIVGNEHTTVQNFWNGTFREPFDFRVTEDAGTVTGTITPSNGHPDMTMIFSDGFEILDTDPGATIDITAYVGTDEVPLLCYIFIPQSTKVLTADTSWPDGVEHIRVAKLFLQSAVTTGTSGALRNQNFNDEIQNTNTNQGHLSHMGQRIRAMVSEWDSGTEATLTVADTANSYVSITSGKVFQMHEQVYPALSMPSDNMEVVNDPDGAYTPITTINSITKTSDGGTIPNNRWFSIVVWGVCNKTGETSHLLCNVPAGDYTSELNAQLDTLGYSNYTIPKEFKGVGFLIARFTVQRKTSTIAYGGGDSYQDLRGFFPNSTAGSGAGGSGITTFLGLNDTPSGYTDDALKVVRVNAGETALEFVTPDAGVTDHGLLDGLGDDDHTQYLLIDGTRAMTGDLDMDASDILNTGDVLPEADATYNLGDQVAGSPEAVAFEHDTGAGFTQIISTRQFSQTFTTVGAFSISKASFSMSRTSGNSDVTVGIYSVDGSSHPTGSALVSKIVNPNGIASFPTETYVDFEFTTPYELSAATMYAVVVSGVAGGFYIFHSNSGDTFANGDLYQSDDSGSSWSIQATKDAKFKVYSAAVDASLLAYRDVYLSRNLSDGTYELTVAEAKEAYDHSLLTSGNPHSVTPGGSDTQVQFNDSDAFGGDSGFTFNKTTDSIVLDGSMSLKEKATANADTEAYGQFWVKDDIPCSPYFTDDAGNDIPMDSRFIDRGDPASGDFELGDFTIDSTYRDFDLSSIVPSNARAVLMTVVIRSSDGTGSFIGFRRNGNVNQATVPVLRTQSTVKNDNTVTVAIGSDGLLEYIAGGTNITDLGVTILGWWLG